MIDPSKITQPLARICISAFNRVFVLVLLFGVLLTFILFSGEPDLLDAIRNHIYEDDIYEKINNQENIYDTYNGDIRWN